MHQRNCALLQSQVGATRRLLPSRRVLSRCYPAVCRHKRAHCKLENRQMAEQTGANGPLGGAATAQGADRAQSSAPAAPAALAGRRCSNNGTIDERHAPMDAYAKTSSFDSKLGATFTERRFLKCCSEASCPHPGVRHARSTSLAARGTSSSGTVGRPGLQSCERVFFVPTITLRRRTTLALGRPQQSAFSSKKSRTTTYTMWHSRPPFEIALVKSGRSPSRIPLRK
jgi:hypothetical protein